jgi:hypothetical protein
MGARMAGVKGSSGGRRVGAGRKPRTRLEQVITGTLRGPGRVLPGPGAGEGPMVAPIDRFEAPADLSDLERALWLELAPHAFAARTLTRATALAFRLLCQTAALERVYAASADRGRANHRGLIQRVEAELAAFNLRPFGKPILEAAPVQPTNPLEKFLHRTR